MIEIVYLLSTMKEEYCNYSFLNRIEIIYNLLLEDRVKKENSIIWQVFILVYMIYLSNWIFCQIIEKTKNKAALNTTNKERQLQLNEQINRIQMTLVDVLEVLYNPTFSLIEMLEIFYIKKKSKFCRISYPYLQSFWKYESYQFA